MALYGECDSYLIEDCDELKDITIDDIKAEIEFSEMLSHGSPVPRLIAIQSSKTASGYPLYRHPADYTPITKDFTSITIKIKNYIEKKLNCNLNHALIQLYRNGDDMIGEHSDKTLDIKHSTLIINYSVGTTRTMRLRKKDKTQIEKVDLTNNSMFVLGPETNKKWLHMIKSNSTIKDERISFTFRNIATFIDENGIITGQGAPKNKINKLDSIDMLKAFSRENHESEYDWNELYETGFHAIRI
jgi:alkylated DNA repair dioxygenase AlkB